MANQCGALVMSAALALMLVAACTQPAEESIASCQEAAHLEAELLVRILQEGQVPAQRLESAASQQDATTPSSLLHAMSSHTGDLHGAALQVEKIEAAMDEHDCAEDPTTSEVLGDELSSAVDAQSDERSAELLQDLAERLRNS